MQSATSCLPTEDDVREAPWSAGVRVGWLWLSKKGGTPDHAVIFSLDSERGYKAADKVELGGVRGPYVQGFPVM